MRVFSTMHLAKGAVCMCGALLVLSLSLSLVAHAAPSLEVGSVIPMTMYVRTERQVNLADVDVNKNTNTHTYDGEEGRAGVTGGGKMGAVGKESNAERAHRGLGSATTTGASIAAHLTDSPATARPHSKHKKQLSETLPPVHCARFGVNTVAHLSWDNRINQTLFQACDLSECQEKVHEHAIRFSFGSNIRRETTWLPFMQWNEQHEWPDTDHDDGDAAGFDLDEHDAAADTAPKSDGARHYLHAVHFYFSYRRGLVNRVTQLRVEREYHPTRVSKIRLHYNWRERRPHNPHAALSVCSTCALVAALVVLACVLWPNNQTGKLFKRRLVTVREHAD